MKVTYNKLMEIAVEAGIPEEAVRTDYSGRYMYGATCVGFDLSGASEMLSLGAALRNECDVETLEQFESAATTDSMGMGIVVYFPGIEVEK